MEIRVPKASHIKNNFDRELKTDESKELSED